MILNESGFVWAFAVISSPFEGCAGIVVLRRAKRPVMLFQIAPASGALGCASSRRHLASYPICKRNDVRTDVRKNEN